MAKLGDSLSRVKKAMRQRHVIYAVYYGLGRSSQSQRLPGHHGETAGGTKLPRAIAKCRPIDTVHKLIGSLARFTDPGEVGSGKGSFNALDSAPGWQEIRHDAWKSRSHKEHG